VALGWGLWEGPARFYFWGYFVPTINLAPELLSIHYFGTTITSERLTLQGVVLIYVSISPNDLF